jgi:hypothetical protein
MHNSSRSHIHPASVTTQKIILCSRSVTKTKWQGLFFCGCIHLNFLISSSRSRLQALRSVASWFQAYLRLYLARQINYPEITSDILNVITRCAFESFVTLLLPASVVH